MYLVKGSLRMLVMLVRVGTNGVLATRMDSELNRALLSEPTWVKDTADITAAELALLFMKYEWEFLGTFPDFYVDLNGEIVCTK